MTQIVEIRCLGDLDRAAQKVGLPVGPRTGRSKEKKEWYVLLGFLKATVPFKMVELPIMVRNGAPPDEPDFVMTRGGSTVGLFEITEATDEADQEEMTLCERSTKRASMLGEFGGRFKGGAGNPGPAWANDVMHAIRRKNGKAIFRDSSAARHLLVYPNSNASSLLFDEDSEREAIEKLRGEIGKNATPLSHTVNGCLVHVLGKCFLCFDALGEMRVLSQNDSQNDTTYVIGAASNLKDLLEIVLRESIDVLSRSSFGEEINTAYELKLIDRDLFGDLHAIRNVMNAFSHAKGSMQFCSPNPTLNEAFKGFSGWTESSDHRALFDERLKACIQALNSRVDLAIFKQAWSDAP